MSSRWEYMSVQWEQFSELVAGEWTYLNKVRIFHPDGEFEETSSDAGGLLDAQYQRFGAEGWELVSEVVVGSGLATPINGWPTGSTAIRIRGALKRAVKDGSPESR